jgi:CHAT domain-containing protein/Tfp pilus assembly protein PilF
VLDSISISSTVIFATLIAASFVYCTTKPILAEAASDTCPASRTEERAAPEEKPLQANIPELKIGNPVEAEIAENQSHRYLIKLSAGQFLHVSVEQKQIDAAIQLLDPTGKQVAAINWEVEGGTESLWALAATTGDYLLQVSAISVKGSERRYIINLEKIDALTTAPLREQTYVAAYRLYCEAVELRERGGNEAWQQAVEKCEAALPLWRTLNDRTGEANTLHELGLAYADLSEIQKSIKSYEQALSIWRLAKDRKREEADTLYNLGMVYAFAGKTADAIASYKKAIELRRLMGDPGSVAFTFSNLGQVYNTLGDFQEALQAHQEALRLRRAAGEIDSQARSLSNISAVYFSLGEFQEALNYCTQALSLRRKTGDRRGEAVTLANIGSIYRELGEPQRALEYYRQALSILPATVYELDEAALMDAVGRSYYDLGNYPKALEYHRQSLSLRQKKKDRYGEGAVLANIGNSYARMGERQTALEYLEQALKLRRAIGDTRGEALTLQNAGELYRESGDLEKASAYFNRGLEISRAIKNRFLEAGLLYAAASLEASQSYLDEARVRIEAAIAIVESTRAKVSSYDLRASFLASKQDFYELEIDLLMQSYKRDHDKETLVKAFMVSERRRARSLLDSLEEAQAKITHGVLPELLARERTLRARLNQKAESQIKLLSGSHTPERASELAKEIDLLVKDFDQVKTETRASSPRYAALVQPDPLSLKEIQALLDPDTLLLEYSAGKTRSYMWAVTSAEITGYELPALAEIESQARNVYELLTARSRFVKFEKLDERQARIANADAEYCRAAQRLSQILLGPLEAKPRVKRLLIVSDGPLQYLPFSALPTPPVSIQNEEGHSARVVYRPLVADHEITSLPSASILAVLRREVTDRAPAPKSVAVLADPVFNRADERVTSLKEGSKAPQPSASNRNGRVQDHLESDLSRAVSDVAGGNELDISRLPFTRHEAKAILGLVPKTDQFEALDFAANREAATRPELSRYRIVHFATHGLLNTTHPGLSGLILSLVDRQGNDQNGFLPAHEVFNLNLPADLVVLSGCRTGLGKEIKGEGLLGLTRGFMYAGAARVAVSLWDVNDESTADLMKLFYRGMLVKRPMSPAAALRQAQIAMWKSARWHAPYYWAAFVLQGEYR